MNNQFLITSIERVILVKKEEYPQRTTKFKNVLAANELIFHLSGNATVKFNNKLLHTKENTIRFLPAGKNSGYEVERFEGGECIDVFFQTDVPVSKDAFVSNAENNHLLAPLFKKLFSVWVSKQEGYYFECISLLYKIFAEMQKTNYIPKEKYEKIKPAVSYIQKNFNQEIVDSETLEALCDISYSYIKKLFMQNFGMSPKRYAIHLKLSYAGDLLSSGMYSLGQVSEMCGYESVSFFNRQFKNYYNMTPTDYIKKYKSSKR